MIWGREQRHELVDVGLSGLTKCGKPGQVFMAGIGWEKQSSQDRHRVVHRASTVSRLAAPWRESCERLIRSW